MAEKISDEKLIADLHRLMEGLGKVPSTQDVDEHGEYGTTTYQRRFGSWSDAKEEAGLPESGSLQEPEPYQQKSRLRDLYLEQDLSTEEIGDRFGVTGNAVSRWVRKHGLEKDRTDPRKDESLLRHLYWEEGMSIGDIADELDTYRDVVHRWMVDLGIGRRVGPREGDYPWQDEEVLHRLYWDEGLTQSEIAERLGTNEETISKWMARLGVETRTPQERSRRSVGVGRPFFYTTDSGYEVVGCRVGGSTPTAYIHKLVAVAEYGFDAVDGNVVHHENSIPWDNRPVNLRPMTDSAHKSLHRSESYDPCKVDSVQ